MSRSARDISSEEPSSTVTCELISREDRDIADSVREVLEQKGIVFRCV